jgi:xylem cysteine proteinase
MSIRIIATTLLSVGIIAGLMYLNQPGSTSDVADRQAFNDFKLKFNKSYGSLNEDYFRFGIFKKNLQFINDHSLKTDASYTLDVNQFADLSFEEFSNRYLMSSIPKVSADNCGAEMSLTGGRNGDQVDWEADGKVQKVKNQAQCGSCWAFSTVGSLESAYAINNGTLPNLSEQELVDCSKDYGNMGCNGGLMNLGFEYIINHGIHSEDEYSYRGVDQSCKTASLQAPAYKASDCVMVPANTDGLTEGLRHNPVSVAFYVNLGFQFYSGGVFDPWMCGGQPNHGVLAVGFNLSASKPYYKVKNSWGGSWGEKGYFRIKIGSGKGTCDMAGSGASVYPVL